MSDNLKLSDVDFLPSAREERAVEKPPPRRPPRPPALKTGLLSPEINPKMAIRFIEDPVHSRIRALEAAVDALQRRLTLLEAGNAVTPVTSRGNGSGNALTAAEKMRRYRARKKSAAL